MRNKFNFKVCKNIDQLYEDLRRLPKIVAETKTQLAREEIRRRNRSIRNEEDRHDIHDKKVVKRVEDGIDMGQLENIFFYLVLDNAKTLFKIERQKKVIEKLAIC